MPKTLTGRQTRSMPLQAFETRSNSDGSLTFTGYASTFDQPYEMFDYFGSYTEVVRQGAFTKTLSENPDVRFLINHDGLPLARTRSGTLQLGQDTTGLHVEAKLDALDSDVASLTRKMQRGDVDEMSFGFRIIRQDWSPDYSQCDLTELALDNGDVSVVTYPANPSTSATIRSLRAKHAQITPAQLRAFYASLATAEKRYGAEFSAANKEVLSALLGDLADIGDAVNEIAADISDSGTQLDSLLNGNADPDDASDETEADETEPEDTDSARAAVTPMALALARAQALRLRAA